MSERIIFTGRTRTINGVTVNQIKAICDFGRVRTGDIGGWVESKDLLESRDGWVDSTIILTENFELKEKLSLKDKLKFRKPRKFIKEEDVVEVGKDVDTEILEKISKKKEEIIDSITDKIMEELNKK